MSETRKHPRHPEKGRRVQVKNIVTGEWMDGSCVDWLSTQWVLYMSDDGHGTELVIHPSWKWRYS